MSRFRIRREMLPGGSGGWRHEWIVPRETSLSLFALRLVITAGCWRERLTFARLIPFRNTCLAQGSLTGGRIAPALLLD